MEISKAVEIIKRDRFTQEDVETTVAILAETKGLDLFTAKHLLEDTKAN